MSSALSTALSTLAAFVIVFAGCLPASAQSCCDHAARDHAARDHAARDHAAHEQGDLATSAMPDSLTQSSKVIASQSPYRISRQKVLKVPSDQQDETPENQNSKPLFDGSGADVSRQFDKWKDDYVRPVVCPVLMCHGNCAKTDLGCKGIYGSILGGMNSCCMSAPPVVHDGEGIFPLRLVDD